MRYTITPPAIQAVPPEAEAPNTIQADDRAGRIAAVLSNAWLWVAIGAFTMFELSA